MTPTGQRDELIRFERATKARSEVGAMLQTQWPPLGTRWAKVAYLAQTERAEADVETASQTAIFNFYAETLTKAVTVGDRIVARGLTWDITGIEPLGVGPDEIAFTATTSRG